MSPTPTASGSADHPFDLWSGRGCQERVDGVANYGGLLMFCYHDIVAGPATSTQVSVATHGALVDCVAGKAGVRVMTLDDLMRSVPASDGRLGIGIPLADHLVRAPQAVGEHVLVRDRAESPRPA